MRILHLRGRFPGARLRLAPPGSPAHHALVTVLRSLADESQGLVLPSDIAVPHGPTVMGRPVPGTSLVVCYVPAGMDVLVMDLIELPS